MASVEKIKHLPLIDHLKENEERYHFLLSNYEIKHGPVPSKVLKRCVVTQIEPLLVKIANKDESRIAPMFSALFNALLKLIGNYQATMDSYTKAWELLYLMPELFTQKPKEVLKVLHECVKGILVFQPENLKFWYELMAAMLSDRKNIDDLKAIGRISAWASGLAHLREMALYDFQNLSKIEQDKFQENFQHRIPIAVALNTRWYSSSKLLQIGGFIGFGSGFFKKPPVVANIDNILMSTDGEIVCAIFKDVCGMVVLNDINFSVKRVIDISKSNKILINDPFPDISSCAVVEDSVILTRYSSHKLFVVPL